LPGKVPEHIIQQVTRSANLVSIVGRHTKLKQRGKKFWGLCPFHKEKTPSFSVDPDLGLYYCFGCKEGGNVFTFMRKVDGLEFYDALQMLARQAGVDLTQVQGKSGPSRDKVKGLREICELAASFYAKCLQKAKGAELAREYLAGRKFTDDSVDKWQLGYAPDGWEHLIEFAQGRSIELSQLQEAGLAVARSGAEGYYDRFRNRLMFPVSDRQGRVIGFGARALRPEDEPKYLNSPEGPLFTKRDCFYGFNEAREAIREGKCAVIMEGYTDVIMAHQFGVEPVMAVLGTALTENHARALKTLCERVVLVFDADEAGQKSATRSIEVLLAEDMDVRVATLGEGEDPCEFLLAHGADAFRERLEQSEDFFAFRLRRAREAQDADTVSGRTSVFEDLAELALTVQNEARRDMLIRTIAGELGIAERSAWAYIERSWRRPTGAGAAAEAETPARGREAKLHDEGLAIQLLGFLLAHADFQPQAANDLDTAELKDCLQKAALERLLERCRVDGQQSVADFAGGLDEPALASVIAVAVAEEEKRAKAVSDVSAAQFYEACRAQFDERKEEKERQSIRGRIATTAAPVTTTTTQAPAGSDANQDELLRRFAEKHKERDKKASRINPGKNRE